MVGGAAPEKPFPPKPSKVADGPINGTSWYVIDNAPRELLAPGGVVLCCDTTLTPHSGAESAAASAWALLRRHQASDRAAKLPVATSPRADLPW